MSCDENFDAGRTLTSSPIPHHSDFDQNANPSQRRIRSFTGAAAWTSGFLPILSTSSLSCDTTPVNCGFGDRTNATNRHRTGLPAALRPTNLPRWLEQDNSDWPASLTCSLLNIRRARPSRCMIHPRPLSSPSCFALGEPCGSPHIGTPSNVTGDFSARLRDCRSRGVPAFVSAYCIGEKTSYHGAPNPLGTSACAYLSAAFERCPNDRTRPVLGRGEDRERKRGAPAQQFGRFGRTRDTRCEVGCGQPMEMRWDGSASSRTQWDSEGGPAVRRWTNRFRGSVGSVAALALK